jgi:hypothetical protein
MSDFGELNVERVTTVGTGIENKKHARSIELILTGDKRQASGKGTVQTYYTRPCDRHFR